MIFINGHVYIVFCNYIKPPHDKICLCFCSITPLFFFINTNPRIPADAQEPIQQQECPAALTHNSFIDLGGAKTFGPIDIVTARARGAMDPAVIARVKQRLATGVSTLVQKHRALALQNL